MAGVELFLNRELALIDEESEACWEGETSEYVILRHIALKWKAYVCLGEIQGRHLVFVEDVKDGCWVDSLKSRDQTHGGQDSYLNVGSQTVGHDWLSTHIQVLSLQLA